MPAELSAPATCGPARESTPTSIHEKPAALTWRRTFVDPDLESIFSEREARASLLPLTARTCWTISMLYLVVVMQQIFEGWPRWSIVTLLATSALYFSVSLVLGRIQAARVLWVRKWMLQVLMVTLLNCSCLVGPLVFVPSRLHALGITSLPMPPEQFATTATDYALKVASSLVASACFAPLDMVPLAVHVFTMIGWFATLETLNGITRHAQIAEIALLLAIGLMAIYFRGEMRGSERQNYHFRANVHAMVMLVREADARELTHKLQAESAMKLTQARSRLIRVVMHDLRSPMLTISNAAHNLDDELSALAAERALPDQQLAAMRSCTHALSTCSHICGNIVRDMLDFERIDSGRLIIVNRPFAVEELLDSTRAAFAALAAQQGISLQIEPLPSWLKGARWRGDVHRLQQCVYNALSNALKFTPAGHAVTVRVLSSAQLTQGARHGDEGAEGSRGGARCEGDDDGVRRVQSVGNMVSRMLQSISPRTRARLPGRARGGRAPPPYAASEADSDVSASRSPASALSAPPGFTLAPKYPTSASSRSARSSTPSVGASFAFGVEVVDEGCGLSPTELELLNSGDVFAQVGLGQLQGSGGSGLGLSIARQLAELHHGSEVELSSEGLGHGTRFLLRVRCAEDAPLTNERELDEEQSGARSDDVPPAAELQPPPAESPGAQPPHTDSASLCVPAEQDGAACAAPSPAAFASSSGGDAACAEHKPRRSGRTSLEPAEPIATDTDMPHSRAAEHVDSRPPPPSAPSKPARALPADFHVLHVEDERLLHRMLHLRLKKALGEFSITHVTDGKQAVQLVAEEGRDFDVVIMDNQMPVMTGTLATRMLRAHGFNGMIIGMTGDPEGCDDRSEFNRCGTDHVLDKDTAAMRTVQALITSCAESRAARSPQQKASTTCVQSSCSSTRHSSMSSSATVCGPSCPSSFSAEQSVEQMVSAAPPADDNDLMTMADRRDDDAPTGPPLASRDDSE